MSVRFRELIQPGTNFEFIGKARFYMMLSAVAIVVSLAMLPINALTRGSMLNWTIDFKGGTEIIAVFGRQVTAGELRSTLKDNGFTSVDVSSFEFAEEGQQKPAHLIRLAEFGAVSPEQASRIADEFSRKFGSRNIHKATWSGDTFYVRSSQPITQAEFKDSLAGYGLRAKPWTIEQEEKYGQALPGTNEYDYEVNVFGLDHQVEQALTNTLNTTVEIKQVDAVGAKAGKELRNNGIMSLLYAIALIMVYIAFRFDFRYGPGTVVALLHDAILVIGVFAVTWTEFSLTTVAAILTVIGYSMNDTIVVFDRIRENEHKLKDKKLDRVINISINETLSRTILTSLTTFVTTLAMNLLGTGLVKDFAFAMNVGIIVGTYSSIFVASPILLWLHEKYWAKRAVPAHRMMFESN